MLLNSEQIKNIGFKTVGKNVLISDRASFYGAENIAIGDNVRIDDKRCRVIQKLLCKYL